MKPEIDIILEFYPLHRAPDWRPLEDYAEDVGKRLCAAEAMEATLATGRPAEEAPLDCLRQTARSGGVAAVCLMDGRAELIWGVRRKGLLTSGGEIWMLRTAVPEKCRLTFARESRRQLVYLVQLSGLSRFENVVHRDNVVAIRWLKWLGFRFDRKVGRNWLHFQATAEQLLSRNMVKEAAHGRGD